MVAEGGNPRQVDSPLGHGDNHVATRRPGSHRTMILPLLVVFAAVLVGLLAGGKLRAFEWARVRWWALAPLGLALQLAPLQELGVSRDWATAALVASFPVLLTFVLRNVVQPGFPLLFVGLALNLAVIAPNFGMPVSVGAARMTGGDAAVRALLLEDNVKHHLMTEDDVLRPLGDVIGIARPWQLVLSVGDLFVYTGLAWWALGVMLAGTPSGSASPGAERSRPRGYRGKHRPTQIPGSVAPDPVVVIPAAAERSEIGR